MSPFLSPIPYIRYFSSSAITVKSHNFIFIILHQYRDAFCLACIFLCHVVSGGHSPEPHPVLLLCSPPLSHCLGRFCLYLTYIMRHGVRALQGLYILHVHIVFIILPLRFKTSIIFTSFVSSFHTLFWHRIFSLFLLLTTIIVLSFLRSSPTLLHPTSSSSSSSSSLSHFSLL